MADQDNIQEPEETSGQIPAANVVEDADMLTEEAPIDRTHASVNATGPTVNEWTPPPYQPGIGEDIGAEPGKTPENQQQEYVNPDLMDLPEDDKLEGATYMADLAIEGYGEVKKELGNQFLPIKQRRLRKLEERGLIDQNILLPKRGGGFAPAETFIENYNQKARNVFGVREKFRQEVRPILIKEFAKKGIGLTPWQRIGWAVVMDLKEDMKIAMGLRAAADEIVEAMKDMTATIKEQGYANTGSAQPAAAPAAEQPPQPAAQPQPIVFDQSKPAEAFDHIQAARAGANYTPPPQPGMPANAEPRLRTVKKRGPYKKKNKKVLTTIHIKPK